MDGSKVVNLAKSPKLLHYRDTCLLDIQQPSVISWNKLVAQKIILPAPFVRLYDSNGNYCGRYIYNNHAVGFQHNTSVCQEQVAQSVCTSPPELPQSTPKLPSTSQPLPELSSFYMKCHQHPSPYLNCHEQSSPHLNPPSTHLKSHQHARKRTTKRKKTCNRKPELQCENEMAVEEVQRQPFETKLARAVNNALGSACDCQSDLKKLNNFKSYTKTRT